MSQPSNSGWPTGYIPTSQEWATSQSAKVDYPAPVDQGGTGAQSAFSSNYNLQQRQLIATNGVALEALAVYGIRTGLGAFQVNLPPLASLAPGDWIHLVDVDFDANVHNVVVAAAVGDQISLQGSSADTQLFTGQGGVVQLTVNGTTGSLVWSMTILPSSATAGAGSLLAVDNLSDLTNVYTALANLGMFYRVGSFFVATPIATETLVIHPVTAHVTFPANFAGSVVKCGINPAASFVMTVYRNPTFTGTTISGGTAVGTLTISTGGAATLVTTGGLTQVFAVGDVLGIAGPVTPDTTIACVGITLDAQYTAP